MVLLEIAVNPPGEQIYTVELLCVPAGYQQLMKYGRIITCCVCLMEDKRHVATYSAMFIQTEKHFTFRKEKSGNYWLVDPQNIWLISSEI